MAGNFIESIRLDARPDRLDLRDRPYTPPVKSLPAQWPQNPVLKSLLPDYVKNDLILNQGSEGACTGFGLACLVNYLFWRRHVEDKKALFAKVSPRMLYHLARFYDEWPGEDYEGSSCRGALKAWHKHGVCREELWPYKNNQFVQPLDGWDVDAVRRTLGVYYRINKDSVVDMQAAIYEIGAVYVSAQVHEGWNVSVKRKALRHESLPVIKRRGKELGGHAFAIVGYNEQGFVVQNSWGTEWGAGGFAVLPYSDWVDNGSDAWACALGVPLEQVSSTKYFVASGPGAPAGAWWSDAGPAAGYVYRDRAVTPWSTELAYLHSVVMGNNGRLINRLVTCEDAGQSLRKVVYEETDEWFSSAEAGKKLVVYAHGGLNSEEDSVQRIRMMAPYFKANGIYPIFLTWKTGPVETIVDIIQDELHKTLFPVRFGEGLLEAAKRQIAEALDRKIEAICEDSPVKSLWSQMKQNAREASSDSSPGGCYLTTRIIGELKARHPELEIHMVGHSAGSIILGHILDLFPQNGLTAASCTLYAPACTVDFANRHYIGAPNAVLSRENLYIHLLSDEREQEDRVGPYGKSLLYLVSRALEDSHKTPILGLANVYDKARNDTNVWNGERIADVEKWQSFWTNSKNLHVVSAQQVNCGPRMIKAAHGSFDNDVDVLTATIKRILGKAPRHRVEYLDY
jgi:hypothetical protein